MRRRCDYGSDVLRGRGRLRAPVRGAPGCSLPATLSSRGVSLLGWRRPHQGRSRRAAPRRCGLAGSREPPFLDIERMIPASSQIDIHPGHRQWHPQPPWTMRRTLSPGPANLMAASSIGLPSRRSARSTSSSALSPVSSLYLSKPLRLAERPSSIPAPSFQHFATVCLSIPYLRAISGKLGRTPISLSISISPIRLVSILAASGSVSAYPYGADSRCPGWRSCIDLDGGSALPRLEYRFALTGSF